MILSLRRASFSHLNAFKTSVRSIRRSFTVHQDTFSQIYSFGDGKRYQLGHGQDQDELKPRLIESLSGSSLDVYGKPVRKHRIIDAAAGWQQSFVVTEDNEVFSWGLNDSGQLAQFHKIIREPLASPMLSKYGIFSVACGRLHSVFLSESHDVFACGGNEFGQCGQGNKEPAVSSPKRIESLKGKKIQMIASGFDHTVALGEDGRVYTWGWGLEGQLGTGDDEDSLAPKELVGCRDLGIVRIACGSDFTLLLTEEGRVYVFGNGDGGQIGNGKKEASFLPMLVEDVKDVIMIAAGGAHILALTNTNQLYAWGVNTENQLGTETDERIQLTPILVPGIGGDRRDQEIGLVAAAGATSFAVTNNGELYSWGFGANGRLGHGNEDRVNHPTKVEFFSGKNVSFVAPGVDHTLVVVDQWYKSK